MQGKVVVITGATSGIGKVAAETLARTGARIVQIARDRQRGEAALKNLQSCGPGAEHTIHYADLSRLGEMKRVAAEIAGAEPLAPQQRLYAKILEHSAVREYQLLVPGQWTGERSAAEISGWDAQRGKAEGKCRRGRRRKPQRDWKYHGRIAVIGGREPDISAREPVARESTYLPMI